MEPGQREQNAALVRTMRQMLEGFLDGRVDHAGLARFAREQSGQSRRLWGGAGTVLDSLEAAEDLVAETKLGGQEGEYVIREFDVRSYLAWLSRGELFFGDEQPFACVDLEHGAFVELVAVEPVRWWFNGLGWAWSVEFCSPGTGRVFGGSGLLDANLGPWVEIRKAVYDADPEVALADLLETLEVPRELLKTPLDLEAVARRTSF